MSSLRGEKKFLRMQCCWCIILLQIAVKTDDFLFCCFWSDWWKGSGKMWVDERLRYLGVLMAAVASWGGICLHTCTCAHTHIHIRVRKYISIRKLLVYCLALNLSYFRMLSSSICHTRQVSTLPSSVQAPSTAAVWRF